MRDAFALAKEKAPAIIFIDEIDAIGTKRFDSELSGDREVQRTMLELLNQLDGFGSEESIKVRRGGPPLCTGARIYHLSKDADSRLPRNRSHRRRFRSRPTEALGQPKADPSGDCTCTSRPKI